MSKKDDENANQGKDEAENATPDLSQSIATALASLLGPKVAETTPEPDVKLDETVKGGRYLVGDRYVDANGDTIKE